MKLNLINEADTRFRKLERLAAQGDPEALERLRQAGIRGEYASPGAYTPRSTSGGKINKLPNRNYNRLGDFQRDFDSGNRGERSLQLNCDLFPNTVEIRPEELIEFLKSDQVRDYPDPVVVTFTIDGEDIAQAFWDSGVLSDVVSTFDFFGEEFPEDLVRRSRRLVEGLNTFIGDSFFNWAMKYARRPDIDPESSFPIRSKKPSRRPPNEARFLDLIKHF